MTTINLADLRAGYVDLVSLVVLRGRPVTVRGMPTRELVDVTARFDHLGGTLLPVGVNRRVSTRLAAVEALALISGTAADDLLVRAASTYTDVLVDPTELAYGSYGLRTDGQVSAVVGALRRDPTTRQAVLSIWRADDLVHTGDRPCTLTLQFLLREGMLHMIVNMRSQDVWLGAATDMFVFGQLQRTVASCLDVRPGMYTHHVGSLHIYERDLDAASRLHPPADGPTLPPSAGLVIPDSIPGVVSTWSAYRSVALHLLGHARDASPAGQTHADVLACNPWYAYQMRMLSHTKEESR